MHQAMAAALDRALARDPRIQAGARAMPGGFRRPRWPMIILRTPKGWTGPKEVDGKPVEGTWRSHQVPMANGEHARAPAQLEAWLRSYRPEELFDDAGRLRPSSPRWRRAASAHGRQPARQRRPAAARLRLPDFREYAVTCRPGRAEAEATRVLGGFLRDVMRLNPSAQLPPVRPRRDRVEPAGRGVRGDRQGAWMAETPGDDHLAPTGA
jgi:xylulose-5-phosphate/fructose-6-phosphate phosphoketolase